METCTNVRCWQYERVGETRTRASNVRILAATNRDLQAAVASGTFREDLLYRLNVFEVFLPPLRQRRKDLESLIEHLLRFFARQNGKAVSSLTDEARTAMLRYPWPGNVRELRNAIERGVILASGPAVGLVELPAQIGATLPASVMEVGGAVTLEQLEAEHIRRVDCDAGSERVVGTRRLLVSVHACSLSWPSSSRENTGTT